MRSCIGIHADETLTCQLLARVPSSPRCQAMQKQLLLNPLNRISPLCKRLMYKGSNGSQKSTSSKTAADEPFKDSSSTGESFESAVSTVIIIPGKGRPPEPPTSCCMSGCSNCVWIKYTEDLTDYYRDSGEMAKRAIELIPDETIKAFLRMAL